MAKRKKIRRTILSIILVGLAVWIARALIDAPPPDDADLLITYEDIPDEENALSYFNLAAGYVYWPEGRAKGRRPDDLLDEDGWDQTLADEILAENEDIFDLVEQGLACPRCQFAQVTGLDDVRYISGQAGPSRTLARLCAIRAEHLFRQGQEEEAFDQAMLIVTLGNRLQNGRGSVLDYMVAIAVEETGLVRMRRMLTSTSLDQSVLMPYISRLDECRASEGGFADAIKTEYTCTARAVDDFASAKQFKKNRMIGRVLMFFTLKPNRTKRRLAKSIEISLPNARRTLAEATRPEFARGSALWRKIKAYASGNGVGENLYWILMSPYARLHGLKARIDCSVAATRILIALKCYKATHGELPDTLDDLVPDYLDAVPLDACDGKPMRYSKQTRVVYSVGCDLKDAGGTGRYDWDDDEPTFKIEF